MDDTPTAITVADVDDHGDAAADDLDLAPDVGGDVALDIDTTAWGDGDRDAGIVGWDETGPPPREIVKDAVKQVLRRNHARARIDVLPQLAKHVAMDARTTQQISLVEHIERSGAGLEDLISASRATKDNLIVLEARLRKMRGVLHDVVAIDDAPSGGPSGSSAAGGAAYGSSTSKRPGSPSGRTMASTGAFGAIGGGAARTAAGAASATSYSFGATAGPAPSNYIMDDLADLGKTHTSGLAACPTCGRRMLADILIGHQEVCGRAAAPRFAPGGALAPTASGRGADWAAQSLSGRYSTGRSLSDREDSDDGRGGSAAGGRYSPVTFAAAASSYAQGRLSPAAAARTAKRLGAAAGYDDDEGGGGEGDGDAAATSSRTVTGDAAAAAPGSFRGNRSRAGSAALRAEGSLTVVPVADGSGAGRSGGSPRKGGGPAGTMRTTMRYTATPMVGSIYATTAGGTVGRLPLDDGGKVDDAHSSDSDENLEHRIHHDDEDGALIKLDLPGAGSTVKLQKVSSQLARMRARDDAKLVECPICCRRYMPRRYKKHILACKNKQRVQVAVAGLGMGVPHAYLPQPPTQLRVLHVSPTTISLAWTPPMFDGGGLITSYELEYARRVVTNPSRISPEYAIVDETLVSTAAPPVAGPGESTRVGALAGEEARRASMAASPIYATSGSLGSLHDYGDTGGWTHGAGPGDPLDTARSSVAAAAGLVAPRGITLTGLTAGGEYVNFRVRAINHAGASEWSPPIPSIYTKPPFEPTPPQAVRAVDATINTITISWEPPEIPGGCPVTAYEITFREHAVKFTAAVKAKNLDATMDTQHVLMVDASETSCVLSNLRAGRKFTGIVVVAINSAGLRSRPSRPAVSSATVKPSKEQELEEELRVQYAQAEAAAHDEIVEVTRGRIFQRMKRSLYIQQLQHDLDKLRVKQRRKMMEMNEKRMRRRSSLMARLGVDGGALVDGYGSDAADGSDTGAPPSRSRRPSVATGAPGAGGDSLSPSHLPGAVASPASVADTDRSRSPAALVPVAMGGAGTGSIESPPADHRSTSVGLAAAGAASAAGSAAGGAAMGAASASSRSIPGEAIVPFAGARPTWLKVPTTLEPYTGEVDGEDEVLRIIAMRRRHFQYRISKLQDALDEVEKDYFGLISHRERLSKMIAAAYARRAVAAAEFEAIRPYDGAKIDSSVVHGRRQLFATKELREMLSSELSQLDGSITTLRSILLETMNELDKVQEKMKQQQTLLKERKAAFVVFERAQTRRERLLAIASRIGTDYLLRCFQSWRDFVKLTRKAKAMFNRAMLRWLNRNAARGWNTWIIAVRGARREQHAREKVVGDLLDTDHGIGTVVLAEAERLRKKLMSTAAEAMSFVHALQREVEASEATLANRTTVTQLIGQKHLVEVQAFIGPGFQTTAPLSPDLITFLEKRKAAAAAAAADGDDVVHDALAMVALPSRKTPAIDLRGDTATFGSDIITNLDAIKTPDQLARHTALMLEQATSHYSNGDFAKAYFHLRRCELVFGYFKDTAGLLAVYRILARMVEQVGRGDLALVSWDRCLQMGTELQNELAIAEAHEGMARAFLARGDSHAAVSSFNKAEDIYEARGDVQGCIRVYQALEQPLRNVDRNEEANRYVERASKLITKFDDEVADGRRKMDALQERLVDAAVKHTRTVELEGCGALVPLLRAQLRDIELEVAEVEGVLVVVEKELAVRQLRVDALVDGVHEVEKIPPAATVESGICNGGIAKTYVAEVLREEILRELEVAARDVADRRTELVKLQTLHSNALAARDDVQRHYEAETSGLSMAIHKHEQLRVASFNPVNVRLNDVIGICLSGVPRLIGAVGSQLMMFSTVDGACKRAFVSYHPAPGAPRIRQTVGHAKTITCVTCYGERIYSGDAEGTICVWDMGMAARYDGRHAEESPFEWDARSKDIVARLVADDPDTRRAVKHANAGIVFTLTGHVATVVSMHANANFLVSGGSDNMAIVWNAHTGDLVKRLRVHEAAVTCMSVHDRLFATGSLDRLVVLWATDWEDEMTVRNVAPRFRLEGHTAAVTVVQCLGADVVSGAADGEVIVWDGSTGLPLRRHRPHGNVQIRTLQFDASKLVSYAADDRLIVSHLMSGTIMQITSKPHGGSRIMSLSFSTDELVTVSADRVMRVWAWKSGRFSSTPREVAERPSEHVVVEGELLGKVAKIYHLDPRDLGKWNTITDGYKLYPGMRLSLYPPVKRSLLDVISESKDDDDDDIGRAPGAAATAGGDDDDDGAGAASAGGRVGVTATAMADELGSTRSRFGERAITPPSLTTRRNSLGAMASALPRWTSRISRDDDAAIGTVGDGPAAAAAATALGGAGTGAAVPPARRASQLRALGLAPPVGLVTPARPASVQAAYGPSMRRSPDKAAIATPTAAEADATEHPRAILSNAQRGDRFRRMMTNGIKVGRFAGVGDDTTRVTRSNPATMASLQPITIQPGALLKRQLSKVADIAKDAMTVREVKLGEDPDDPG